MMSEVTALSIESQLLSLCWNFSGRSPGRGAWPPGFDSSRQQPFYTFINCKVFVEKTKKKEKERKPSVAFVWNGINFNDIACFSYLLHYQNLKVFRKIPNAKPGLLHTSVFTLLKFKGQDNLPSLAPSKSTKYRFCCYRSIQLKFLTNLGRSFSFISIFV